jgi:hypothetical protein
MGERKEVTIREKLTLNSANICVARAPESKINILMKCCNSLIQSHMLTGMATW